MKEQSDKFLIDQITGSNYAAFGELYNRHWKQLYKIAVSKTGDGENALDLVQELFIDIWQRRDAIKIEKSVDTYLISALFYKVFMHFRKKGLEEKHLKNYSYYLEQFENGIALGGFDDHHEVEYARLIGMVADTIEQMPDKMREVFNLKHTQSLSIAEISEILGISTQTVKNQLSNAMMKLRKAATNQVPGASASLFICWLFS